MQDINNKLADLLDGLTSFFERFVDDMAETTTNQMTGLNHLASVNTKLDALSAKLDIMTELLRTIAANTAK